MGRIFDWLTLVLIGAMLADVLTHASGFATAAGSVFSGVNGLTGIVAGR